MKKFDPGQDRWDFISMGKGNGILTELELNIREVIKVGGVINGLDSDWDSSRSLSDMIPVHICEPTQLLHVFNISHSLVSALTKSRKSYD